MTKDLRIYFGSAEDELFKWFKNVYGSERSRIIKEHLKNLRETCKTADTEKTAEELLKHHFGDIASDTLWIAQMRKEFSEAELKTEIKNRLTFIKKLHPETFGEVANEFEKIYPNLTKLVKP